MSFKTRVARIFLVALVAVLASNAGWAQLGVCSARGTVLDPAGDPVVGAVVTFKAGANPANDYTGKTNKKGRYSIDGLYTPKENDRWFVTVVAEGYLPVKVTIESRNVNRVLVGDIMTQKLGPTTKIPDFVIRPMGQAKVNLTMAPEDEVMAQQQAQQQVQPSTEGEQTSEGTAPAPPKKDPWEEAVHLASSGDLEGSLDFFEKAVEDEPEDAERHEAYAKVLYQLDEFGKAESRVNRAIELEPERLGARMVLYSIQASRQDWPKAGATLEQAREIAPKDIRVLEQMAYVASQTGDDERALAVHTSITELRPENANSWLALGSLHAKAGDDAASEAAYQRVIEIDPSSAYQTFFNVGALIMNRTSRTQADTERAIEAFRKALEIKPDYWQAQQQLAFALLGVGDRGGARQALEAYLDGNPKAADAAQMQAILKTLPQ